MQSGTGGSKPCRRAITVKPTAQPLVLVVHRRGVLLVRVVHYRGVLLVLVCAALATQLSWHKNCPAPGPQTSSAYITPSSASAF